MVKKFIILGILVFSVTSLLLHKPTYAGEFEKLNLKTEFINPGDFYYPTKRLWEKIKERFNFSSEGKLKYFNLLLDVRMSELGFVVKNKRLGQLQQSSERLAFYAGRLTEDLIKYGTKEQKDKVRNKFKSFLEPLDELRDNFPANSSFWMLIQHDINSLKEYSEKLAK